MRPINRLLKSNTIENLWIYILLLIKSSPHGAPLYAWQVPDAIEEKFGFKTGKITPYRVLYRLEEDGFVESRMDERKRIYKLTSKGRDELESARKLFEKNLKFFD